MLTKSVMGFVFSLILLFFSTSKCHADDIVLPVPLYTQPPGSSLCWLACAQMAIAYENGTAPSQCEMLEIGNSLPQGTCCCPNPPGICNYAGFPQMIANCIANYCGHYSNFALPGSPIDIHNSLHMNKPIVAFLATSPTIGHYVVIKGITNTVVMTPYGFAPNFDPILVINDPTFGEIYKPYSYIMQYWQAAIVVN